jgi:hypothetical protein
MILATTCGVCGIHHNSSERKASERKSWAYHEAVRAKTAGLTRLPMDLVGDLPSEVEWSLYQRKEASSCSFHYGPFSDLHRMMARIGGQVLPGGDKREAPLISSVSYNNGRQTDENCEAIHVLWFDCDGAGPWDELMAALKRSGVAAIFQQSTSRKPGRWHVGIPVTKPITFERGEWTARAEYKLAYRHVAAVFSAMAGFDGVGGHCGLDLGCDRLIQPMFLPMRRSSEDSYPGLVYVDGGAVDYRRLLEMTNFDMAVALGLDGKQVAATRRRVRRSMRPSRDWGEAYDGELGPLGQALKAAGFLGRQKDAQGVHCKCPWPHMHSSKGGEWDAIYFPGSDTWWCPHSSCKGVRGPEGARLVAEATGSIGMDAYKATLEKGETIVAVEKRRESTAVRIWLDSVKDKAPITRILNALAGAMLRKRFSSDFIVDALCGAEARMLARERVQRTVLRMQRGSPVPGAGWLRRTLGLDAVRRLSIAVASDSGSDPVVIASYFLGMGMIRGDAANFLWDMHNAMPLGDKLRSYVVRPSGCRLYGDKVRQFGADVGVMTKVCESLSCPRCFFVRLLTESEMLRTGWEFGGKHHEAWTKTDGHFAIHRVEGLKDVTQLGHVFDWLSKYSRVPRVRLMDWRNGAPCMTLLTDTKEAAGDIKVTMQAYVREVEGATYERTIVKSGEDMIAAAAEARINLHVHQLDLIHSRDKEGLLSWLRWIYRKKQVIRSKKALPWPTREAMKARITDANQEDWDIDYELGGVSYTAVHLESGYEMETSDHPHPLYRIMQMAKYKPEIDVIMRPRDREEEEILNAKCLERAAREGINIPTFTSEPILTSWC